MISIIAARSWHWSFIGDCTPTCLSATRLACNEDPLKLLILVFSGLVVVITTTKADNWDLGKNSLRLGIAEVGWTVIEEYQGTKLLLDADLVFERASKPVNVNESREKLKFLFDARLQFGNYQNSLDYAVLAWTYWAYQINRKPLSSRSFQTVRDQLELGKLIAGYDDTLNIDYYTELEAGRLGRFWSYQYSNSSSFTITLGLNASLGWAWVESVDKRYAPVSNPVVGFWNVLLLEHNKLGQLYLDRRVKNGFNFGLPNETNSREGNIRYGYQKDFSGCMALDVFAEKRSFTFKAFNMPDLYDKTKRFGVELICRFL